MGGAIHHIGPVGSGMVLKLAVNGLFGVQVAALAELLAMVQKAGVDRDRAIEVVGAMSITSPAVKWVAGLMAARAFEPLFPIDLVEKDFGYIVAAAERAGAEVPTAAAVRAVYARARDAGHGADNISGVIQVFE
jgi:3-hydroxyisobutyrate dehydrogenase-like beta-hydroxyacid dehydrogenase